DMHARTWSPNQCRSMRCCGRSDCGLSGCLPARGGFVVASPRLDPGCGGRRLFLFPERPSALEVVHDELARGEGLAAMRARHADQHDLVGGLQFTDAMDDECIVDV